LDIGLEIEVDIVKLCYRIVNCFAVYFSRSRREALGFIDALVKTIDQRKQFRRAVAIRMAELPVFS
jgi:hypothetical protein